MQDHQRHLLQTLELAQSRRGFCAPNPAVGAIIVQNDQCIATGVHMASGHPHAEIDALQRAGERAQGATLYVSLEPCCHFGKTPPCTTQIIESGIKEVVYAYEDPNPQVAGKGAMRLIEAGVDCQHLPLPQIDRFYSSYQHWVTTKRPWVRAKLAISLDGKIAGPNKQPVAITGRALNQYTHLKRKQSDAILTTARTIEFDDPQLNVRLNEGHYTKPVYVLDSRLSIPSSARVIDLANPLTVFHLEDVNLNKIKVLEDKGVKCVKIGAGPGGLNLEQALGIIGAEGVHDLWVEAGGTCFQSFLDLGLVHQAYIYKAAKILGPDAYPAFSDPINVQAKQLSWYPVGSDVVCELEF